MIRAFKSTPLVSALVTCCLFGVACDEDGDDCGTYELETPLRARVVSVEAAAPESAGDCESPVAITVEIFDPDTQEVLETSSGGMTAVSSQWAMDEGIEVGLELDAGLYSTDGPCPDEYQLTPEFIESGFQSCPFER